VVARGEALLDGVDPELAGRFLSDASFVDTMAGRFDAAAAKLERSLAVLPADSAFRSATQINLALNRWDAVGDYDGRVAAQTRTLDAVWRLYPSDAPGQCRDLAMLHAWAGDRDRSPRGYLEQALRGERANPIVGLEARAASRRSTAIRAPSRSCSSAPAPGAARTPSTSSPCTPSTRCRRRPIADARRYFAS
jgi:hypothetical protein